MARRFVPKRHWTPRYLKDRIMQEAWSRRHPTAPWMNRWAVGALDGLMKPTDEVLEFGSGRSTAWLAERAKGLVSIETDHYWFESVTRSLADDKHNVDLRLAGRSSPDDYLGTVRDITAVDVVVVDGAYRGSCACWAADRLRRGGFVVIDDAHRYINSQSGQPVQRKDDLSWREFLDKAEGWRSLWTHDGVAATAFFLRA